MIKEKKRGGRERKEDKIEERERERERLNERKSGTIRVYGARRESEGAEREAINKAGEEEDDRERE